jgi:hypothetical protein
LISKKHKKYSVDGWNVCTVKYQPKETPYNHLVFALKYEGINLLFFKKSFDKLNPAENCPHRKINNILYRKCEI